MISKLYIIGIINVIKGSHYVNVLEQNNVQTNNLNLVKNIKLYTTFINK